MEKVTSSNAALVQRQELVAVFFGATSGIGHYTLRALATTHAKHQGKGLRVYIVGRSPKKTEDIVAECKQICPNATFHTILVGDLGLLKDVDRACAEIARIERETSRPRIDFLFMTQGGLYLGKRKDTAEGLEVSMAMHFYSRARCVTQLLPLLVESELPAHVVSVFAAGLERKLIQDDLSLRKPGNYNLANARSHVTIMMTLFMEHIAKEHRSKISLVNVHPGLVISPAFHDPTRPAWFRIAWLVSSPVAKLVATKHEVCGDKMLFFASDRFPARGVAAPDANAAKGTDGELASGAYACNLDGESVVEKKCAAVYKSFDRDVVSEKIWDHIQEVFSTIEKGERFTN